MIYDYQDVATKYYLVANVRDWANLENNALLLLQNRKVREITEADLSFNSTDDVVWTAMYLIGVGLLRYVVSNKGDLFQLAVTLNWKKPEWLFDVKSRETMNRHIDMLMEIEQEGRRHGLPPTACVASLEIQKYRKLALLAPEEPVMNDMMRERHLIIRNKKLLARKRSFHRGRRR